MLRKPYNYIITMNNQQISQILKIANSTRNKLIKKYCPADTQKTLKALCLDASVALKNQLVKYHYKPSIVRGTFLVDNPECLEDDSNYKCILHYWIEIELNNTPYILDITAEQFNDELDHDSMPDIVFDSYSNLPRYTKLKTVYNYSTTKGCTFVDETK